MKPTRLPVVEQIFGQNKAPIQQVLDADFDDLVIEVDRAIIKAGRLPSAIKDEAGLGDYGAAVTEIKALAKRIDGIRTDEGRPLLDAKREVDAFFNGLGVRLGETTKKLEAVATDYQRAVAAEARRKAAEEAERLREKEEAERRKAEEAGTAAGAANAEGRAERFASRADRAEEAANASAADLTRTRVGGVTASAKTVWDFRIKDYAAVQATLGPLGAYLPRADVEKAIRSLLRIQKDGASLPGVEFFEDVQATFRK